MTEINWHTDEKGIGWSSCSTHKPKAHELVYVKESAQGTKTIGYFSGTEWFSEKGRPPEFTPMWWRPIGLTIESMRDALLELGMTHGMDAELFLNDSHDDCLAAVRGVIAGKAGVAIID